MAFRIHVTAIRDSTVDAVRETYGEIFGERFSEVPLIEHGGWISFRSSVWQVSSRDLVKGMEQLNQPGLQFTTEDGSRWYVTLCRPDSETESLIHEFGYHEESKLDERYFLYDEEEDFVDPELDFLEDEQDLPKGPKTTFQRFAEQYAELGVALPESLIAEAAELSFNDAINRFRKWHADRFVDFLTATGVNVDEAAVRQAISWQGLTAVELESDLGNLPRLLSAIGLGEEWDNFVAEAETPPDENDDELDDDESECDTNDILPRRDPSQWLTEVEEVIGNMDPTPIENGTVNLPIGKIGEVPFFVEACQVENEIKALIVVELPESLARNELDRLKLENQSEQIVCSLNAQGFKIGFENHLLVERRHIRKLLGIEFTRFFEHLPDGSKLTLAFGAQGEPATRQIYRGEILNHEWCINATCPPLPASVLSDAFSLAADAPKFSHTVRDAIEADAVMEAVKMDGYLHGMDVQRTGNTISCEYDVEFLAKVIFRIRFRDYWDVQAHEQHAHQQFQERIRLKWEFLRNSAKQAREQAAPRIGAPIFRGKASVFWHSNFEHFNELEPEPREKFIRTMEALNFRLLGDLTCKRFRDFALRCYISPDGYTYSCLTASKFGYLCFDFITDFSDGSRFATTTLGMAFSRPAVKMYFRVFSGLQVEDLYEKHLQTFEKFKSVKDALPVSLEPTLEGVARRFDDSIERTDIDEANCEAEELDDEDDDDEFEEDGLDEFDF